MAMYLSTSCLFNESFWIRYGLQSSIIHYYVTWLQKIVWMIYLKLFVLNFPMITFLIGHKPCSLLLTFQFIFWMLFVLTVVISYVVILPIYITIGFILLVWQHNILGEINWCDTGCLASWQLWWLPCLGALSGLHGNRCVCWGMRL